MAKSSSRVVSVVTSAVLAAAVTLALGWPKHVNAVGNEEQAAQEQGAIAEREAAPQNTELAKNESKIGDLEVTATLAESETTPGQKVVHIECNNPTDGRITGKLLVALTRTSGSGGERVMPRPQIAWRHNEAVDVAAGEKLIRDVPLPRNMSKAIVQIEKAQQLAASNENARSPNVYYDVMAEAIEPPVKKSAQAKAMASNSNPLPGNSNVGRSRPYASKLAAYAPRNSVDIGL